MKQVRLLTVLVVLALLLAAVSGLVYAQGAGSRAGRQGPVGTAFTYQGLLTQDNGPVDDSCDFQFSLWDDGGTQIGATLERLDELVDDGRFTVELDFGAVFDGTALSLEIAVRCGDETAYTTLTPRQPLTAAPYALALPGLWTQPNGTSSNLIGGYGGNVVTSGAVGATISGGGALTATNRVTDDFGAVGGGGSNQAGDGAGTTSDRQYATVGGGAYNTASGELSAVAGGNSNVASGSRAFVGGGAANSASDQFASVGGGYGNAAVAEAATVGGGWGNTADGIYAAVGGGQYNTTGAWWATVAGGEGNLASGEQATIGGGSDNSATMLGAVVGGGSNNVAGGERSTVSGGAINQANGEFSAVGGGIANVVEGYAGTVAGGDTNQASGMRSTVGGGYSNVASNYYATVGGGWDNIASGSASAVGGGNGNEASGQGATVGGGNDNIASGYAAAVMGGESNAASSWYATVGGGHANTASNWDATVGGGDGNHVSGEYATIGGGRYNTASGLYTTVAGGLQAAATHHGEQAQASGQFAAAGDAQTSQYVMRREATMSAGTWHDLYLDGVSALLILASGRTVTFDILIVGRTSAGESAGYRIQGLIENVGGTTALVGTPTATLLGEDDSAWSVRVIAEDVTDALLVQVQGNGESIRWVATVRTAEVAW